MKSDFLHINAVIDGKEYYLKVDSAKDENSEGAKIIIPGTGTIALSTEDVQKIVDFRAGFDYNDVICRRRKVHGAQPDTVEYNVLNSETNELVLVSFILKTDIDQPDIKFGVINVANGKEALNVTLPFTIVDVLLREFASKGYVSDLMTIKDIKYVDALPNETAADSSVVYLFEDKYYKLNAAEDAFTEITGTFDTVNTLPEFTPKAKEGVLYRLTSDWVCPVDKENYSKGIYTFSNTTKDFTLTELKVLNVKLLPEIEKAEANTLYVLNRQIDDKPKGSIWYVDNDAWVQETRELVTDSTLPIIKLAVKDTIYIVAGKQLQQATANGFTNLGRIVKVKELPDTSTVTVETDVVYVLTKAQGDKPVGGRYVFDGTTKEFVAYTEE